jgi:predicted AlkP superfamily pyrophosphatase or phosphodiesterase
MIHRWLLLVLAACLPAFGEPGRAQLHLVLVMDGLRPDSITAADTPNLHRLRTEGVSFESTHAVFPTVTRVNATAIATGSYPARNGIMGNSIFVPAVDPVRAFTNDDADKLLKLGENIVTAPGLADALEARGERYVVVSSGSTGSALLLAPRSPGGLGTVVNGYFDGTAAYPRAVSDEIVKRFGPAPKKGDAKTPFDESVTWGMRVLMEYVLPEWKPRVVVSWLTEPDHIQHGLGVGSPAALESIRRNDAHVGTLLATLEKLGLRDKTDIFVVSDHGFAHTVANVNVEQEMRDAGLLTAEPSAEVVLASSGQAMAVHVKDHDPAKIARIVEFLQKRPWCGLVFTAGGGRAAHEGRVPGTFSLEYAHLGGHERSPDIVFTFPWSSAANRYGVPGTEHNIVAQGASGPVTVETANHGGIGPWTVRNTMLAWGADFKRGARVRTPAANVDVAPTILYLLGDDRARGAMDGRVLREALANGPDEEQVPVDTRALRVQRGDYRAVLQVSETDGKLYVDKGWRER